MRQLTLCIIAVTIHAIDPREDFGDGGVELRGDFAADAAVFKQAAGERFVFDDGDLMLLREFTDFLRVQADAFGHNFRRAHGFAVVAQGDGDVRGVDDDDVGFGDFGELLGFADGAAAAARGFDLGIAFGALGFFLHFLFGHHEVLLGAPPLVAVIRRGDDDEAEADAQENAQANFREKLRHARDVHRGGEDGVVQDFEHFVVGECNDEQQFENATQLFNVILESDPDDQTARYFVENAIRYGVNERKGASTILVTARADSDAIRLSVEERGDGKATNARTNGLGIGLRNTRQRLAARFGEAATLELSIDDRGRGSSAVLTLPKFPNSVISTG